MEEPEVVLGVALPSIGESPAVEQPREQPLDLPSAYVAAQRSTILGGSSRATGAMGSDQLDSSLFAEPRVERIAVVSSVANKAIGCVLDKAVIEGLFDERDLMWRSACDPAATGRPWRSAIAMILVPLPRLVFPTAQPPFLPLRRCRQ